MTRDILFLEITDKLSVKANNIYINLNQEIHINALMKNASAICLYLAKEKKCRLMSMFAIENQTSEHKFQINYVFSEDVTGTMIVMEALIDGLTFPSISDTIPSASLYEREIKDMFGLFPAGHPDPRRLIFHSNWPESKNPLRKDFGFNEKVELADIKSEFKVISGEGIFEIPVGPVHAGIIEPGHFRFSLAGEPILNLEAQLYFVHKGIEKLAEGKNIEHCFYISERISGDETFTNSLAYCQAIEKIAGAEVPSRALFTRVVFAELERLTSHLGDLAGICLDTAYGFAAFQFRMIRGLSYRIADELCQMRFLRSVNKPGGIRKDFVYGKEESIISQLNEIKKELEDTVEIILKNSIFVDRIETTGILSHKTAYDLNAVGPGGRASGINHDIRKLYPYAAYNSLKFNVAAQKDGDVASRMKVKLHECFESISLMIQAIETMPEGEIFINLPSLTPFSSAYGLTEAPRGENIHFVMVDENQKIARYKVRTPSFCNWPALCHAVAGNIVPDFPLINKSFNLSYAGNDL